ncbi:transcription elongation factor GreA [Candidatus Uhrbacteria bacterium]|nr:transcription elongation factor GreA [Candidatus Uhrbacteria bacterium]
MRVPRRRSEILRRSKIEQDDHLTPQAIGRLEKELHDLRHRERPEVLREVTRTREMGDLSENAAYHDAKARLARIDGRIFSLEERLKSAIPIRVGADPSGRIRIGSTVVVRSDGKKYTYQMLGSHEVDPSRGRISHQSPLGAALVGHVVGEDVMVKIRDREVVYHILEVK